MSSKFCGKVFNRGFILRRHENDYCSLKNHEREMSETESSQTMDSEDDALTDSTRGSESPVSTDNESETEEDPWMQLHACIFNNAMAAFVYIFYSLHNIWVFNRLRSFLNFSCGCATQESYEVK